MKLSVLVLLAFHAQLFKIDDFSRTIWSGLGYEPGINHTPINRRETPLFSVINSFTGTNQELYVIWANKTVFFGWIISTSPFKSVSSCRTLYIFILLNSVFQTVSQDVIRFEENLIVFYIFVMEFCHSLWQSETSGVYC